MTCGWVFVPRLRSGGWKLARALNLMLELAQRQDAR